MPRTWCRFINNIEQPQLPKFFVFLRASAAHIKGYPFPLIFYKMLYWINWIVLLSLEPLAGELEYASVEWSAAGAWVGRVSNV